MALREWLALRQQARVAPQETFLQPIVGVTEALVPASLMWRRGLFCLPYLSKTAQVSKTQDPLSL